MFLDDSSQAVIDLAVHGSRIMGFAFLLNGFNIFSGSFFTALDNAKWSLVISVCRGLIFIVIGIFAYGSLYHINHKTDFACRIFIDSFQQDVLSVMGLGKTLFEFLGRHSKVSISSFFTKKCKIKNHLKRRPVLG